MGFAEKIQKIMVSFLPDWVPRGKYREKEYVHIFLNKSDNFIDGKSPEKCDIKGNLMEGAAIKYHTYASHMNSSQVMCISFFKKFFDNEDYERILLNVLRDCGVEGIGRNDKIIAAAFEYEPERRCNFNEREGTNLDFYMELSSDRKISIEVKYTESEFGSPSDKIDKNKYKNKWNSIYKKMVKDSPFLCESEIKECDDFCRNYQINRNIAYAGKNDYVLFLTPKANDEAKIKTGREYIEKFHNAQIKNIYWEELMEKTKKAVNSFPELKEYYAKFCGKYISILDSNV